MTIFRVVSESIERRMHVVLARDEDEARGIHSVDSRHRHTETQMIVTVEEVADAPPAALRIDGAGRRG